MQAWYDFLSCQERLLSKATVDRWLRPLKIARFDARNLYLTADDPLCVTWFEEHIRPHLHSFFNNNHQPIKVHITSGETLQRSKSQKGAPLPLILNNTPLNPRYTFEEWVIGPSNQIPSQLLQQLNLGSFNPIFVHGPSGTGKTHLLMAIASAFNAQGKKALYTHTDTFTEHVVTAIRSSSMQAFREYYRHVDLLIVDDIHQLAKRFATQEEFFHTFNALHMAGKQIILASEMPPTYLVDIEPRLTSRFEWGLLLPLLLPERDELQARLQRHPISPDAITWILDSFPRAAIQRVLDTLFLRRHLDHIPKDHNLSLEETKTFLQDLLRTEQAQALTPQKIIHATAVHWNIAPDDLLSSSHRQEHSYPRQVAMYLCRKHLHLPFAKIGALFSRDHSTVMTSIKLIQERFDALDADLASALYTLERLLLKSNTNLR